MTKLYVVEQGEYSDHRFVGIYDTEEKAEFIRDKINMKPYQDASIYEYELNPGYEELNAGLSMYNVHISTTGKLISILKCNDTAGGIATTELHANHVSYFSVYARDEAHATKIALDKFYIWKSQPKPIPTPTNSFL